MGIANDHSLEQVNLDSDDKYEKLSDVCSFLLHAELELENLDTDDEYESQSDDETDDDDDDDDDDDNDEAEDEAKITEAEMREELAALKAEADLPLEEMLKAYPKKTIRSSRESIQVLSTDPDEPPFKKHKTNNVTATGFLAGSNTLEITDYSITKKLIKTGNYIQSDIFTVGGYQWVIEFYPQGWDSRSSEFISIRVRLVNPTNDVQAMSTHRFKDWNTSKWSTDTLVNTGVDTFSSSHTGWGYIHFIKRSDFETSSYLRSDTLVIKTNLLVVKDISR